MVKKFPYSQLRFAVASLTPLFLPESAESKEEICGKLKNGGLESQLNLTTTLTSNFSKMYIKDEEENEEPEQGSFEMVMLGPCLIIGLWQLSVALLFLLQAGRNIELPTYQSNEDEEPEGVPAEGIVPKCKKTELKNMALIGLGFVFYVLFNGVDSYFKSQTYTYGLCGPLHMSANSAGWLNTLYYSLYLTGRLISIPLSTVISPGGIVTVSNILICK